MDLVERQIPLAGKKISSLLTLREKFAQLRNHSLAKSTYRLVIGMTSLSIFEYNSAKVRIRNREEVTELITRLRSGGPSNLQVITDFDFTLSKAHTETKKCLPAAGIIRQSSLMPEEFKARARERYYKLLPVELDPTMTIEQKIPIVVASFKEGFADLVNINLLNRKNLAELISNGDKNCNFELRDRCDVTLQFLNDENIPVVIFSAGFGDVVEGLLKKFSLDFPNIHVIGNFMDFDENDKLIGFKEPLIHSFNKDESVLPPNCPFLDDLAHRKNVILLGDLIGDVTMANGVENPETVLKIGFLNDVNEELLDNFLEIYDIVLLDDQTMDFVNCLLREICTTI